MVGDERGGPRISVLVNPVAGAGKALRIWRTLEAASRPPPGGWNAVYTEAPLHATELARQAIARGCERLIVLGGDGTVQETAVALEGSETALGIVRAGTGNDFSRTHLIPSDPTEALALACEGTSREFDLGRVNGHLFVNIAGLGFDAEVAAFCHNRFRKAGPVIYIFGVFAMLVGFSPQMMTFTLDGVRHEERCLVLAVGNGRYYGGGMMMCPAADPGDGLFDVCVGGNLGKLETIRLLTLVFSGRHVGQPGITIYRAKRVVVDSPAPLSIHADGEPVGRVPAEFTLASGRLRLVVPN